MFVILSKYQNKHYIQWIMDLEEFSKIRSTFMMDNEKLLESYRSATVYLCNVFFALKKLEMSLKEVLYFALRVSVLHELKLIKGLFEPSLNVDGRI